MDMRRIFILCIEPDKGSEPLGSAKALEYKYKVLKKRDVRLILLSKLEIPCDNITGWQEVLKKNHVEDLKAIASAGDRFIGVYVVAEGVKGFVGDMKPGKLAELVAALGFKAITKLALVACSAAVDREEISLNYLDGFCRALVPYKLTPAIAGWTGFVSVVFPGMKFGVYHRASDAKVKSDEKAKLTGKKFISAVPVGADSDENKKYYLVDDDTRQNQKKVVKWNGEKPHFWDYYWQNPL